MGAYLRLYKCLMAPGLCNRIASECHGQRSEVLARERLGDALAAVYLRLRHVGGCESRKDKRKETKRFKCRVNKDGENAKSTHRGGGGWGLEVVVCTHTSLDKGVAFRVGCV